MNRVYTVTFEAIADGEPADIVPALRAWLEDGAPAPAMAPPVVVVIVSRGTEPEPVPA